ncbi:radical SAM protein [Polymorphum gilvum]|uniref:Metallo cofactor biosynthesis protein, conjectural n=1 Tax=Polymorphum gilvum (strain LMG 25793 / CGMCC 1.9160 / SL003B-26A1) TaxID=991905 RepID=F2IY33_POLGS|nr:radical SAM protein [Polymorphum gilvum]ADZ70536.1 Metallo cofactor biosynthesis protein, conjectural [Polymorphum gilvum SL003B-26A1]
MTTDIEERPFELGLMYSHRCNIECRHCGIESGPRNRARMTLELARDVIQQAAELDPPATTIAFTGGEPLLYPRETEALLDLAHGLGLSTRIVTNGFWGRNRSRGLQLLYRLRFAGLDTINFSADAYHLEYLNAAILRQAIDIAEEVGFIVIVNMTVNAAVSPVDAFSRLYGIARERLVGFDETVFRAELRAGADLSRYDGRILVSGGRLIGLGRAALYPEEHFLSPLETFARTPCSEIVNRPVVYPDGALMACCCAGGKIAAFRVGNLHSQPLADLVEAMRRRTHFRFINDLGPRVLYEALAEMRPRAGDERPHASICDVCVAATRGRAPDEVDRLLEHWLVRRLVEA